MTPTAIEALVEELGTKEYLIQILMYEKGYSREKATTLYDKWMESDEPSFLSETFCD